MIESVLEQITILPSNTSPVTFNNDEIRSKGATCCGWLQHRERTGLFKILEGGLYDINFSANVTSATAGTVAFGLFEDGILVPGTQMIAEVVTAGDYYNISFNKLLKICCRGDATLTIASIPSVLTGATLPGTPTDTEIPIIQNANFSIVRKS
jgi:hypothetical protein